MLLSPNMRVQRNILFVLVVALLLWTQDRHAEVGPEPEPPVTYVDLFAFDIAQRTCALEIVIMPRGMEGLLALGYSPDGPAAPQDENPAGTLLACAPPPVANADTVGVGMPEWN